MQQNYKIKEIDPLSRDECTPMEHIFLGKTCDFKINIGFLLIM